MKQRLGTLIRRARDDGSEYMIGNLGEAVILLEPDGETKTGAARWRLMLAPPEPARTENKGAARNQRGAKWRIERRKAEGVEHLGGDL